MTALNFKSDFPVELIQFAGSDELVCQAARVSTAGWDSLDTDEAYGLLSFLMSNRHGSPFEHTLMTWRIACPIFVWREFMRHRIASYNEESGRYKQLEGAFYIPPPHRPLQQVGKPGAYEFVPGSEDQYGDMVTKLKGSAVIAYNNYQSMLDAGVAKEVSRMLLPVNIYSSAWVSMNIRGLMNFLSLRTKHPDATFKSFPQWEINQVADRMEQDFAEKFPAIQGLFRKAGSVCP